jgi:molybdopterin synthase catalytic subunit
MRRVDRLAPQCSTERRTTTFRRLAIVHEGSAIGADDHIALQRDPIASENLVQWATTTASGAVVCFLGVVRDHADGRDGVHAMTYEAYEEQAERALLEVAVAARDRWPDVQRIALVHRVGELALSEASVAVVVSSPHRDVAFEAARYCIDTLKESVPIWKQEHWSGGSDWALGETPIKPVARAASATPGI